MCGLFGGAGNFTVPTLQMLRDLMLFSAVRGVDSSGLALVHRDKVEVVKTVGHPLNLIPLSKEMDTKGVIKAYPSIIIGHTRAAASFGRAADITTENAHPIVIDHIVGAHNGVLTNTTDLEDGNIDPLDSRALFKTVAKHGIDDTWTKFLGAAAVVWWDDQEKILGMVRNSERPLWITCTKNKDAMFWASEPWMLRIAASRNNVSLSQDTNGVDELWQPKDSILHVFSATPTSFKLEGTRELKKRRTPVVTSTIQRAANRFFHPTKNAGGLGNIKRPRITPKPRRKGLGLIYNQAWSTKLDKADKNVVGTSFWLEYSINNTSMLATSNAPYLVGRTAGGKRVVIHPANQKEFEEWDDLVDQMTSDDESWSGANIHCKFTSRPRIQTTKSGTDFEFHVAAQSISQVVSRTNVIPLYNDQMVMFKGNYVTPQTWEALFKHTVPDQTCAWCGTVITVEDANTLSWVGKNGCLCPECTQSDEVRTEVMSLIGT